MGLYQTNGHSISIQMMRKFVISAKLNAMGIKLTDEDQNHQKVDFNKVKELYRLSESFHSDNSLFEMSLEQTMSPKRNAFFDKETLRDIRTMFSKCCNLQIDVISAIGKSTVRIKLANQILAVNKYRGDSSYSYVFARWSQEDGYEYRPAVIDNLFEVTIPDGNQSKHIWIAKVKWFRAHEKQNFYGSNSRTKLWSTLFERDPEYPFIPVRFIRSRYLHSRREIQFDSYSDIVTVCITLPFHSML